MRRKRFKQRAEWIWRQRGLANLAFSKEKPFVEEEKNRYVYFRKTFVFTKKVKKCLVHVSADGRYQLFVNGNFVGRGPARCSPEQQIVDPYDLASFLKPGKNVIAALVHSYGRNTSWYELPPWEAGRAFGCGGFFLQGVVQTTAETILLDTDDSWCFCESEAWQRDVPSGSLGFIEIYDTQKEPTAWRDLDFDATGWQTAEILRVRGRNTNADVVPFPMLVERDIPHLFEEIRLPAKVLTYGDVKNDRQTTDIVSRLENEKIDELKLCKIRNPSALCEEKGTTQIITTDDLSAGIVIDFGEIVSGRIHFDLEAEEKGAVIDFTFGDRLQKDGRVKMFEGIPGFDPKYAHRYVSRKGRQNWEQFEWFGFRYLQMTVRNCSKPLTLHTVAVNFTAYPVQQRGRFACSDELLNKLWLTGAKTVSLAMHDAYDDCPTREQRQWVGDGYVQMLVNFAAFGDTKLAAHFLRQIAGSQQPNGLVMMMAPGDFAQAKFTNIPDFCLYWIMEICRYINYSGDSDILTELYPAVVKAIAWFEQYLNDEFLLTDVPHWVFIDWAELDKSGQVAALNAQFVEALHAAADFSHTLDLHQQAENYDLLAQRITEAINNYFWDDTRDVYVDARKNGVPSRRVSQQTNAAVMAFNIAPETRWQHIFRSILDENRLVLTRAWDLETETIPFDEEKNVVMAQPFYCHHLHKAMNKAGLHEALLRNIRKWSCMLEDNHSTFWETWKLHEISSKCHGWSATPTFDLSTYVLGVRPIQPGFTKFSVSPTPAGLDLARGVFPTPKGDILIEWENSKRKFDLYLKIPGGTEAEIVIPLPSGKQLQSVTVNEKPVDKDIFHLPEGGYKIIAHFN